MLGMHTHALIFTFVSRHFLLIIFCMVFCVSLNAHAQTPVDDIARFSKDVFKLAPDWSVQRWRDGKLKLHPANFGETDDNFYMTLYGEEQPYGRSAQAVLTDYFDGRRVGDADNERPVSMQGAEAINANFLVKTHRWTSFQGQMVSFWGVIKTSKNRFIPFWANCNMQAPKRYDGNLCVTRMVTLATALQQGVLRMPQTEAPLYLPGWGGKYENGVSQLRLFRWTGAGSFGRQSLLYASPARSIAAANLQAETLAFANKTAQIIDGKPQAPSWNGPLMKRLFPEASEGPSIQLAAAVKNPDGRHTIVSLRCYNSSWTNTCALAFKRAVQDVESGFLQERVAAWR
jgi:hypothetical protein